MHSFPLLQTNRQAAMNTKKQSDGFTAVHEHTHVASNPVVCAELFSVTGQHCSA